MPLQQGEAGPSGQASGSDVPQAAESSRARKGHDAFTFMDNESPLPAKQARTVQKKKRMNATQALEELFELSDGTLSESSDSGSEEEHEEEDEEEPPRGARTNSDSSQSSSSSILSSRNSDDDDPEVDFPNYNEEVVGDEHDIENFEVVEEADDLVNGWKKFQSDPGPGPLPDFTALPGWT